MAIHTLNTGGRDILKIVYLLQLAAGTVPADNKVSSVNTFIGNANGDSTKVTLIAGASFNPSAVQSGNDTEGNNVMQAIDISDGGTWNLIAQTPEEYEALKTAFNGQKCRVVGVIGDPDVLVDPTTQVVTAAVGDQYFYSHDVTLRFYQNTIDGAENQIPITFGKQVDPDLDSIKKWATIVADV